MTKQKYKKNQMFKKLLKKMYEKGEMESDISTKDLLAVMEIELRDIVYSK